MTTTTKESLMSMIQNELDNITRRVGIETVSIQPFIEAALERGHDPKAGATFRTERVELPNWNNVTICLSNSLCLGDSWRSHWELRVQLIATAKEQAVRLFEVYVPHN